jgi:SAM-dependent methyltransferase
MRQYEYPGDELDIFSDAVNWKRYFARLLEPYVTGSVLEVGAGLGETTRELMNANVRRWVCLEPDPQLAKRLATKLKQFLVMPEVIVGDLRSIRDEDRFESIVYIDVLEHIRADAAELRAASAHLHPGGHLVVLSPAYQFLYSKFDSALGHERRYTRHTLNRVFPPELEPVTTFYADSVGVLLSLANKILLRQALPTAKQIRTWDQLVVPVSRVLDPIIGFNFGRSVIAVYRRPRTTVTP